MPEIVVQYPAARAARADGEVVGETNRVITLPPGAHLVELEGDPDYVPACHEVTLPAQGGPRYQFLSFSPAAPAVDRYSPLYSCYNGFLLGQFLTVMYARYAWDEYPVRRARCQEFLDEIGVEVRLPEQPVGFGEAAHLDLLKRVLLAVAQRSAALSEFALLGWHFLSYGHTVGEDEETARGAAAEIERLRAKHGLLPVSYDDLAVSRREDGSGRIDEVLSPALRWLAQMVDGMEAEPDTAFVIMPFAPPYAGYFFLLPACPGAGGLPRLSRLGRALRRGLLRCLLLGLIGNSGMVWADVSEPNHNVFYEVGAAHAFGKPAILVRNRAS